MGIRRASAGERRREVLQLMEHRAATGESWRSISKRTGINYATLTGWVWRLRRERADQAATRSPSSSFIELVPREASQPERSDGIELVLRGERRLRIGSDFDAATLTRLVHALEAC